MSNKGQPKIKVKKGATSQPLHRDEQGQPLPKQLKMEGQNIPSTSHQSVATSKQSNDWQRVICNLCNQQYKDPRLLDCLHSFCLRCLDNSEVYQTSSEKPRILRCPDCHQDTDVPPVGVLGLCKDFLTTKLVEEQRLTRQLLPHGPQILCEACNENQLAVARCLHCNEFLCKPCKKAHQRLTMMKSHTLVTLDDLRSGKGVLKNKISTVRKCMHHSGRDLCMFCITCQEMICSMCAASNHCKPVHDFVDIQTAEASCRSEILQALTPLEVHVDVKELQVAKTSAERAKKKLESNVKEILDKIDKKTSELEKLITRAKVLKEKAESVAKERGEVLGKCLKIANMNATETEFVLGKARSIVMDGDWHDMITLKEKVLKNLKRVSLKKAESVPLDLCFMDFAESSTSGINLGELLFEEVWTLKDEFGNNSVPACNFGWVKAVAACSNGDTVVLDTGTRRVMTFTSQCVQKGTINSTDPRGILETPIDIALSTSGNILVLDSEVKVFDKEGNFISQMALPEIDASAKCIDAGNGKIAIGMNGMILLINEDGSNPISIPAKEVDKHIAICSKTQSLIYTNYNKSKLVSVDFSGRENFNVSTVINHKSVKPTSICTDKTGDIYIAVHTGKERGTGEIHHYSPEGSYIGFVAKKLFNPLGLSFSPIGELIVADRHSVKVFKRV